MNTMYEKAVKVVIKVVAGTILTVGMATAQSQTVHFDLSGMGISKTATRVWYAQPEPDTWGPKGIWIRNPSNRDIVLMSFVFTKPKITGKHVAFPSARVVVFGHMVNGKPIADSYNRIQICIEQTEDDRISFFEGSDAHEVCKAWAANEGITYTE